MHMGPKWDRYGIILGLGGRGSHKNWDPGTKSQVNWEVLLGGVSALAIFLGNSPIPKHLPSWDQNGMLMGRVWELCLGSPKDFPYMGPPKYPVTEWVLEMGIPPI